MSHVDIYRKNTVGQGTANAKASGMTMFGKTQESKEINVARAAVCKRERSRDKNDEVTRALSFGLCSE